MDHLHRSHPIGIRKRMNFLGRASSLGNSLGQSSKCSPISIEKTRSREKDRDEDKALRPDDVEDLSPLEYRSDSSGDTDRLEYDDKETSFETMPQTPLMTKQSTEREAESSKAPARTPRQRPRVDTENLSISRQTSTNSGTSTSRYGGPPSPASSKAWYEFDLAVVVALVSPIGNWLTGGDHVKNLLLIILLIFYLHQIIEVPWTLYQQARPRKRGLSNTASPGEVSDKVQHTQLMETELKRLELFLLSLTVLSPFIGALLLRYGTEMALGPEAVSWFSVGVFVLATGMRPWRHLVNRIQTRTSELHDFIHYPELNKSQGPNEADHKRQQRQQREILELQTKIEKMERTMKKLAKEVTECNDEMAEYIESGMSTAVRKQEKKWDRYEGRMKSLERVVQDIQIRAVRNRRGDGSMLSQLKHGMLQVLHWTLEVSYRQPPRPRPPIQRRRSLVDPTYDSASAAPLETIAEEDLGPTIVVDEHPPKLRRRPSCASLAYGYMQSIFAWPLKLASTTCSQIFRILTVPVRAVVEMVVRTS